MSPPRPNPAGHTPPGAGRCRSRRSQSGASLILVLVSTIFLSTLVVALLGLAFTGSRLAQATGVDRTELYAATSAVDSAIQTGRRAGWVGRYGLACPTLTTEVDGTTAVVTCVSATGPFDIDRTIAYTAMVQGRALVKAHVIYRDSSPTTSGIPVQVTTWTTHN